MGCDFQNNVDKRNSSHDILAINKRTGSEMNLYLTEPTQDLSDDGCYPSKKLQYSPIQ